MKPQISRVAPYGYKAYELPIHVPLRLSQPQNQWSSNFSSGEAPSAAAPVAGSGVQPHQRAAATGQRPAATGAFWAAREQPRQLKAMPQQRAATTGQQGKGSSQSAHQRGALDATAASGSTSSAYFSFCCRVRLFLFPLRTPRLFSRCSSSHT